MKKMLARFLLMIVSFALSLRYRVTIKGLDKIKGSKPKPGGFLFLPNHTAMFVDPTLIALSLFPQFSVRPLVIEYMFYSPFVYPIMRWIKALPIPNFDNSNNSLKLKRNSAVLSSLIQDLKRGEHFLLYPAGRLKTTNREIIGGTSAVHSILQSCPEANVVLVRMKGMWGSSFSKALTGKTPPLWPTLWHGIKKGLKNFIFFTPRRNIIIEFEPVKADFPYKGTRFELNRYLENWYNQPDHLTQQEGTLPGDSLILVSYSMWSKDIPTVYKDSQEQELIDYTNIDPKIKEAIVAKISELAHRDPATITLEQSLSMDIGLDSLDTSELAHYIQDTFSIRSLPPSELTTVGRTLAIASSLIVLPEIQLNDEVAKGPSLQWNKDRGNSRLYVEKGSTIPEVFLNVSQKQHHLPICGDERTGMLTYSQLRMRVILIGEWLKKQPGKRVGILLPSSSAAYILTLACQLAGKVPVMINWTVGRAHLEAVMQYSELKIVVSSWAFIDRLQNADITPLEDNIVLLEDIAREHFNLTKKIRALILSHQSTATILRTFKNHLTEDSEAVLLFTSGSENMPKGVPLSHRNILSNIRSVMKGIEIFSSDVLLGMLPPFHSFGFTINGFLPLLSNMRVVFSPDPNNRKALLRTIENWHVTFIASAPTFLNGIFKSGEKSQLSTLRFCFTGAEKTPDELFQLTRSLELGDILFEGYGVTECSPVITVNRPKHILKGVGLPMPDVKIMIIDPVSEQKKEVGQEGMILALGPNVFKGYLNHSISSPFIVLDGETWYKTGDLGILDEQGYLTITGRLKRFVKIGGEMVSLGSLEESLRVRLQEQNVLHKDQNAIHNLNNNSNGNNQKTSEDEPQGPTLAVSALEESGEKTQIILFTTLNITLEQANALLRQAGHSALIKISKIFILDQIPLTGIGKINYRELEKQHIHPSH